MGALAVTACGSNSGGPSSSPDAATDVVQNDSPPACPETQPSPSSACTLGGMGIGCSYPASGGCGVNTCRCTGSGPWQCYTGAGSCDAAAPDGSGEGGAGEAGLNDGPVSDGDTCPADPPPPGGSCSGGLSCSYCNGAALCDCNLGQWECGGSTSCMSGHD
ncbi:MAG TPA: hypothetical protein VF765_22390 [Polyangiaceae bacterium]